jgi:phage terminase small subunit
MKLTAKQSLFVEAYLATLNATQAAIKAGYSKNTAAVIGCENLRKPNIRHKIDERLKELALSSDETLKSLSDIAKSSLNDYFVVKEVIHTPQELIPLADYIKRIERDIEDADKFVKLAKITNKDELAAHKNDQEYRRREIIRLKIELERNPKAKKLVSGEPVKVQTAELDMPKLIADKANGRIKAIKHTEYGLNVELYAADAALRDMARYHGLFEKDNAQQSKQGGMHVTDEQFDKILQSARETKTNKGQ